MSAASATALAATTLDDDAWDDLHEAAGLIDGLVPEVRATHDVRQWRARITEAQQ